MNLKKPARQNGDPAQSKAEANVCDLVFHSATCNENDTRHCQCPDRRKERPTPNSAQSAQKERGIGGRDQKKDCRMIQCSENLLQSSVMGDVVERGKKIQRYQRDSENEGAS